MRIGKSTNPRIVHLGKASEIYLLIFLYLNELFVDYTGPTVPCCAWGPYHETRPVFLHPQSLEMQLVLH